MSEKATIHLITGPERDDDAVPEPWVTLERLRRSVLVTPRARRWLAGWRSASPIPWDTTVSSAMTANAVELSALTEFVAINRAEEPEVVEHG